MNKREHLLTILMEEASEVAQAASKALRFGLNNISPYNQRSNAENILLELAHVKAALKMLVDNGDLQLDAEKNKLDVSDKIKAVNSMMSYSRGIGILS